MPLQPAMKTHAHRSRELGTREVKTFDMQHSDLGMHSEQFVQSSPDLLGQACAVAAGGSPCFLTSEVSSAHAPSLRRRRIPDRPFECDQPLSVLLPERRDRKSVV